MFTVKNDKIFIKDEFDKTPEAEAIRKAIYNTCDSINALDWLWDKTASIINAFCQYNNLDDSIDEIADGLVDVYNTDRSKWLALDVNLAGYIDEANQELGDEGSIFDSIGRGQYMLLESLANNLLEVVKKFDK